MTIVVIQPLSLSLVLSNTGKDFLRYIGYLNVTKYHIKFNLKVQGVPQPPAAANT